LRFKEVENPLAQMAEQNLPDAYFLSGTAPHFSHGVQGILAFSDFLFSARSLLLKETHLYPHALLQQNFLEFSV